MMEVGKVFKPPAYVADVDSVELSRFVTKQYGGDWSLLARGDYSQDTYLVVDVDASQPDGWYPSGADDVLTSWLTATVPSPGDWDGQRVYDSLMPHVDVILWDLWRTEVIAPGKYLIRVWW